MKRSFVTMVLLVIAVCGVAGAAVENGFGEVTESSSNTLRLSTES